MKEKLSSPVADRPKIPFLNQDALKPDVGSRRRDLGITEEKEEKLPGFNLREDRTTKTLVTVLNCTIYNCYHPRLKTENKVEMGKK